MIQFEYLFFYIKIKKPRVCEAFFYQDECAYLNPIFSNPLWLITIASNAVSLKHASCSTK